MVDVRHAGLRPYWHRTNFRELLGSWLLPPMLFKADLFSTGIASSDADNPDLLLFLL
jgi:hypothetical protein